MRILVCSSVGPNSGYGRDGIGLVKALLEAGHEVDLAPLTVYTPLPAEVAALFTYGVEGKYDLEIHHVPPMGANQYPVDRNRSRKTVLWTMWEWDTFPKSVPGWDKAMYGIPHYDHVVAYTQQTIDALRSAGPEGFLPDDKVSVVQGGIDPTLWYPITDRRAERVLEKVGERAKKRDTMRFAMVGVLSSRKNPYTVIRAFNELKEEHGDQFDAELLLKTDFPVLPQEYDAPGVRVIRENWSDAELRQFYWSIDCLINCSWGEGKDLPAMEATLCGVPTIINDTAGHRGWVHPFMTTLLPTTKINMDPEYVGRFTGAEDIKSAMMDMYKRKPVKFQETDNLRRWVEKEGSWDKRVSKFLEEI